MSTIETGLAVPAAPHLPHPPTADIPKSNVWDAIKHVRDTLAASIAALTASLALAQYTADDARNIAMTAQGAANEAQRARRHDNAQTILNAQVFN